MAAQPPDYAKPELFQEQAEPADRMTLDTALVPGDTEPSLPRSLCEQKMDRQSSGIASTGPATRLGERRADLSWIGTRGIVGACCWPAL